MDAQTISSCAKGQVSKHSGAFTYHEMKIESPVIRRKFINDDGVSIISDHRNNNNVGSLYSKQQYVTNESLKLSDIIKVVPVPIPIIHTSTDIYFDDNIKQSIDVLNEVCQATSIGVANQLEKGPIKVPCLYTSLSNSGDENEAQLNNDEPTDDSDDQSDNECPIIPFSVSITKMPPVGYKLENEDQQNNVAELNDGNNIKKNSENKKVEETEPLIAQTTVTDNKNLTGAINELSLDQNCKERNKTQLQSTTFDFTFPQSVENNKLSYHLNNKRRMLRSYSAQFLPNQSETVPKLRPLSAMSRHVMNKKGVVPNIVNFHSSDVLEGHSLSMSQQAIHTFNYIRYLEKQEKKRRGELFGMSDQEISGTVIKKHINQKHLKKTLEKSERVKILQKHGIKTESLLMQSEPKAAISSTNNKVIDYYLNDVQYSFRLSMPQTKNNTHNFSQSNNVESNIEVPSTGNPLHSQEISKKRSSSKTLITNSNGLRSPKSSQITFNHSSSNTCNKNISLNSNYNTPINTSSKPDTTPRDMWPTRRVLNTEKEQTTKTETRKIAHDQINSNKTFVKRNVSSAPPQRSKQKDVTILEKRTRPKTASSLKQKDNNPSKYLKRTDVSTLKRDLKSSVDVEICKKIHTIRSSTSEITQKTELGSLGSSKVSATSTPEPNTSLMDSSLNLNVQSADKTGSKEIQNPVENISNMEQQLLFTPKKPDQKKKCYRNRFRRKPPETMVSKIKNNLQNNRETHSVKMHEYPSNIVETATVPSHEKKVRFQQLSKSPDTDTEHVKKSELDAYFMEREITNSMVPDECSDILAKLTEKNINISMDTLKRALMKPYERTYKINANNFPQSGSTLFSRPEGK